MPLVFVGVLGLVTVVSLIAALRAFLGGGAARPTSRQRGVVYGSIAVASLVLAAGVAVSGGDLRSPWFATALIVATALAGAGRVVAYRELGATLARDPEDPPLD